MMFKSLLVLSTGLVPLIRTNLRVPIFLNKVLLFTPLFLFPALLIEVTVVLGDIFALAEFCDTSFRFGNDASFSFPLCDANVTVDGIDMVAKVDV